MPRSHDVGQGLARVSRRWKVAAWLGLLTGSSLMAYDWTTGGYTIELGLVIAWLATPWVLARSGPLAPFLGFGTRTSEAIVAQLQAHPEVDEASTEDVLPAQVRFEVGGRRVVVKLGTGEARSVEGRIHSEVLEERVPRELRLERGGGAGLGDPVLDGVLGGRAVPDELAAVLRTLHEPLMEALHGHGVRWVGAQLRWGGRLHGEDARGAGVRRRQEAEVAEVLVEPALAAVRLLDAVEAALAQSPPPTKR